MQTFSDAFPNGTVWNSAVSGRGYDVVLLGREQPLSLDLPSIQGGMSEPRIAQSLREVKIHGVVDLLATYATRGPDMQALACEYTRQPRFQLEARIHFGARAERARGRPDLRSHGGGQGLSGAPVRRPTRARCPAEGADRPRQPALSQRTVRNPAERARWHTGARMESDGTESSPPQLVRVEPRFQHYAWGDKRFIPELYGIEGHGSPYAEAWLGAHAVFPSQARLNGRDHRARPPDRREPGALAGQRNPATLRRAAVPVEDPVGGQATLDSGSSFEGSGRGGVSP